jgi:CheY-like chemotaxis protein
MVELENRLLSELSESHVMAGSRCRVLVIEDDPETGKQLVQLLVANGYQVDLAVNGDMGSVVTRGSQADH